MSIGLAKASIADRPHRVLLQNSGAPVPDGDGNFTVPWFDLAPPAVFAAIEPATAADLERVAAGTVLAMATHIITIPFHPQVTTATRVVFNGRRFSVTGVSNPEERNVTSVLVCVEVVL